MIIITFFKKNFKNRLIIFSSTFNLFYPINIKTIILSILIRKNKNKILDTKLYKKIEFKLINDKIIYFHYLKKYLSFIRNIILNKVKIFLK